MMEVHLPRSWKEEFAQAAAAKREDILFREKLDAHEADERRRRRKEQIKQEREEREDFRSAMYALAPPEKIVIFRERLDRYDTKTVEALMENSEALDAIRQRIDRMLLRAHVLPDGRRVFKTMDGTKVFDENGTEMGRHAIDAQLIDDAKPRWENFKAAVDEKTELLKERQDLSDYQSKVDQARAKIDAGGVTNGELDSLGESLEAAMPEVVRRKMADKAPARSSDPNVDQANSPVGASASEPAERKIAAPSSLQL
jgi:hypothetical protein